MAEHTRRTWSFFALCYACAVIVVMALSFWPSAHNASRLLGILLSLPWGLGVELLLDSINPDLVQTLGPPLVAICGFFNAFLLQNLLGARRGPG